MITSSVTTPCVCVHTVMATKVFFLLITISAAHSSSLCPSLPPPPLPPSAVGVDPSVMGIGPAFAVRSLLERNSLSLEQVDLVEVRGEGRGVRGVEGRRGSEGRAGEGERGA